MVRRRRRRPQGAAPQGEAVRASNGRGRTRSAASVSVNMAETEPLAPERPAATGWTSRSGIAPGTAPGTASCRASAPATPRCDAATDVGRVGRDDTRVTTDRRRRPHGDLGTARRARPRFAPAPLLNAPTPPAVWALDRLSDRLEPSAPRHPGPGDRRDRRLHTAPEDRRTPAPTRRPGPAPRPGPTNGATQPSQRGRGNAKRPDRSLPIGAPNRRSWSLSCDGFRWAIRGSNPEPMD